MSSLSLRGVLRIWTRFGRMLIRHPTGQAVNIFLTPTLNMMVYGLGIGALVPSLQYHGEAISYGAFALAGLMAMAALFCGFIRGTYGGFFHMHYEHLYQLVATSPITLEEMVLGEISWAATQATLAGAGSLCVGLFFGFGSLEGIPYGLLSAFLIGWLFCGFGLIGAALAERIGQLEYLFNIALWPMLYISGAFFPIHQETDCWACRFTGARFCCPSSGLPSSPMQPCGWCDDG